MLHAKIPPGTQNENIYSVIRHIIPVSYENTYAYLFKRKPTVVSVPHHTMVLFYRNLMLQIFLSFRIDYLMEINGKTIDVPIFPPYFDGSGSDQWGMINPQLLNFSSNETTIEEETVSFKMNSTVEGELVGVDMNTGKITDGKFDPKKIVGFFLDHAGTGIKLPTDNDKKA